MVNVVSTTKDIHSHIEEIVQRNNQKIQELNALPPAIRSQMDLQIFDDIEYLLRYINALHAALQESVPKDKANGGTFSF